MFTIDDSNLSIGVDIEDISRFRGLTREKDKRFLSRIFTDKELDYCFSRANTEQHLAGRFTAKEAVIKALNALGKEKLNYREIEVLNDESGTPVISILKEGFRNIQASLSLSHTKKTAIAFTIAAQKARK